MKTSYNAVTRWVHWLTALLVVTTFILGPEDIDEAENLGIDWSVQVHETFGLIIFGLSIFRIVWTLFAQPRLHIPKSTIMSISANTTIITPFAAMENAGELLLDLHPVLADSLMWLAGARAAAALFHHYILKDTVLKSMMSK